MDQFKRGEIEGCSSFVFPNALLEQPFECYIAPNVSGPFQTVFRCARVGEIHAFGRYLKFVIIPSDRPAFADVGGQEKSRDAFRMMMDSQLVLRVPEKVTDERTGKDRMKNTVVELIEQKQLGWSASHVDMTGRKFVDLLTDVLWYIDGCHKTLEGRRLSVPHVFSDICGFNKPESHGHKRVPMEAIKLRTFSTSLFKIGEEPWLSHVRWSNIKEAITNLATNLSSYCDYLDKQRVRVASQHQSLVPIRSPSVAQEFLFFKPSQSSHPSYTELYKSLNDALQRSEEFSPIFLNHLSPHDARQWRYYLDNLPKGLMVNAVKFSHAYGNHLGTLHFIWRVPEGISPSDMLSRNMKTADSVKGEINVYHTRAMRREAMSSFGRICGVKPAFLRELYKRLTGDTSASRTTDEAAVDTRIRLVLDSEDPSIISDLRELNEGRPERYTEFWKECDQYLESVPELAVHERRHGQVTYLAAALSAQDLLTEVAKRCPEGTPIPSEAWLRYQFWPKDPSKKSASQYTGRLRVKHMVQARQFRKFHPMLIMLLHSIAI